MRMLLAWILQMRAALESSHPADIWTAPPLQLTAYEIDLPYKEIAAELQHPDAAVHRAAPKQAQTAADEKRATAERMDAKMAAADALIMASLGMDEDL
jgi:hypothetical protein